MMRNLDKIITSYQARLEKFLKNSREKGAIGSKITIAKKMQEITFDCLNEVAGCA